MRPLTQRRRWRVIPTAAAVRRYAGYKGAVIINIDPSVGFRGAV